MPTYGICAGPEHTHALREAGFDYVEGSCQAYLRAVEDDDAFAGLGAYAGDSALPIPACNLLLPGEIVIAGGGADLGAASAYMERLLRRAKEAGVDTVVFGSGRSRRVPEGFDRDKAKGQILDFLRDAAPMAEAAGVTIAIEPLNRGECNILNGVAEASGYAREVGSPGVKVLVDSYHSWLEDEPPAEIEADVGLIRHVHVADKEGRVAPGESGGGGDVAGRYREFFGVLKRGGYDGRISIEGKVDFEVDALRRTLGFLKEQWDRA